MKGQILVSVLMTCYNREKYISFAIESVLKSTYQNFELIIVDDGSKDRTVSIIDRFEEKDKRIKVYKNLINLGDYPNRNLAATYANGKYIKYVDSDDYIYPQGLEVMVKSMEQFPEAGFGLCSLKPDMQRPFPFALNSKDAYEYHFFGPGLFHKGPLTAIFLKTAFDSIGGFKEERMISDTDMWHRMSLKYPLVLMQDGLVWQRIHDKQELVDLDKYILQAAQVKWRYLLKADNPLSNEQLKKIKLNRLKRYLKFTLGELRRGNIKKSLTYLRCFGNALSIKI